MKLSNEKLEELKLEIINYIRRKIKEIGADRIVIGLSGGKDSSVCLKLSTLALTSEKVTGLIIPDGKRDGIELAEGIAKSLNVDYKILDINKITREIKNLVESAGSNYSDQSKINTPSRVRMTLLYAYAQSNNGAVLNTSNLSEDWVGYSTIYGDAAGAFSPLASLTTDEVVQLGLYIGLDEKFVNPIPSDGLTGKTDEEVLGFSYKELNDYIREGIEPEARIKEKIDRLNRNSRFKFKKIDMFNSKLPIAIEDIANIYDFEEWFYDR